MLFLVEVFLVLFHFMVFLLLLVLVAGLLLLLVVLVLEAEHDPIGPYLTPLSFRSPVTD